MQIALKCESDWKARSQGISACFEPPEQARICQSLRGWLALARVDDRLQLALDLGDELWHRLHKLHAVSVAHNLHIASTPEAFRAAHDQLPAATISARITSVHAKLEQADWAHGVWLKVQRDDVRLVQVVHLPVDLLFELLIANVLLPATVPICATWVEDRDRHVLQLLGERGLPVDSLAHLDAAGEEHRWCVELWPHWWCEGLGRLVGWYAVDRWCGHSCGCG